MALSEHLIRHNATASLTKAEPGQEPQRVTCRQRESLPRCSVRSRARSCTRCGEANAPPERHPARKVRTGYVGPEAQGQDLCIMIGSMHHDWEKRCRVET
eukprot:1060762-Rhodomonas_salina.3